MSDSFNISGDNPDELYKLGIKHLNDEFWGEAVATFRKLILIDPGYKGAWQRLDEAQEKARKFEDLEFLYQVSEALLEKEQWETAIIYLRRIADSGEKYKDVATLLETADRQLRLQARYARAEMQLKNEQWEEAIRTLEEAARIDPAYKDVQPELDRARTQRRLQNLYERALDHIRAERWPQAIRDLQAIREEAPDYLDIAARLEETQRQQELAELYRAGLVFQETGRWEEASDKFKEIIRRVGSYKEATTRLDQVQRQQELARWYDQGEDYRRQRIWKEAEEKFKQVYDEDPNYRDVRAKLDEAQRQRRIEGLRKQGETACQDEDWQKAVEAFKELRRLNPKDGSVITRLDEAERQLDLAKHYRRGKKHFQRRRWRKAKSALTKVVSVDANYRDAATLLEAARNNSKRSNWFIEALRDPLWQSIGVIVTILIAASPFVVGAIRDLARPTPEPETLCNGDFENDFECWQHEGELGQDVRCEGGQCYAVLGNPDYTCEGGVPVGEAWIKQSFQVLQTVSPTLSLRYRVFSYDLDIQDFFQVRVNGNSVGQFGNSEWNESSCNYDKAWDSGWQTVAFDLSPYVGEKVEVLLRNVNATYEWWNTWTYVDDVKVR
jgi:tetratricopeptide (TPR) repeat protein